MTGPTTAAGRLPIKVHRVAAVEEVRQLEAAGVDFIGFHVDEDAFLGYDAAPFWDDDRHLMVDQLPELLDTVSRARPFVECSPNDVAEVIPMMVDRGVSLLQVNSFDFQDLDWLADQGRQGIEIIYGQHYIVPGDDPRFSGLTQQTWPALFAIDLQLFPSEDDAWELLADPDPSMVRDIVHLADIEELAGAVPLFLSVNLSAANAAAIRRTLAGWPLKGISLTLSPTRRGSVHSTSFEECLSVVRALGPHVR